MNAQLTAHAPTAPTTDDRLADRLKKVIDGGPAAIEDRLCELDSEWSAGRLAKATAGGLVVVGFALAAVHNPWWLVLPAVGGLVFLQYLVGRRSLMTQAFRGFGFRTGGEIEQEKFALKALRGDFHQLATVHQVESRDDITRLEGEGGIVFEPEEAKVDPAQAVQDVISAAKK